MYLREAGFSLLTIRLNELFEFVLVSELTAMQRLTQWGLHVCNHIAASCATAVAVACAQANIRTL